MENKFNEHYIKFGVDFNLYKESNIRKGYISPNLMSDLKFYSIGTTKLVKRYMLPIIASVIKNMCKRNRLKFDLSECSRFVQENMTLIFNYNRNNNPIISKFGDENLGYETKQKEFLEDMFKPSISMRISLQTNEEETEIHLGNTYLEEIKIEIPVYYGISISGEELLYSRVLLIKNNVSTVPRHYEVIEYTLEETRNKTKEEQFKFSKESDKLTTFVDGNSLALDSITWMRLTNSLNKELINIDEENEKQPKIVHDILYILNSIKTRIKEDEKENEYKDLTADEIRNRLNEIDTERQVLSNILHKRNYSKL